MIRLIKLKDSNHYKQMRSMTHLSEMLIYHHQPLLKVQGASYKLHSSDTITQPFLTPTPNRILIPGKKRN